MIPICHIVDNDSKQHLMRMNMLSKITFVVTLASLLLAPVKSVAADEFTPIFDGKSFDGWKAADMSFWTIEDDALTAKITKEHPLKQNLPHLAGRRTGRL